MSSSITLCKCAYQVIIAETEQGVAQAILRGNIDFKREPWPNVSDNAKDLVRQMLQPDPKLRLTAKQVLGRLHLYIELILLHCMSHCIRSVRLKGSTPVLPRQHVLFFA